MSPKETESGFCIHRLSSPPFAGTATVEPGGQELVLTLDESAFRCLVKADLQEEFGLGLGRCSALSINGRNCPWFSLSLATSSPEDFNAPLNHFMGQYFERLYATKDL